MWVFKSFLICCVAYGKAKNRKYILRLRKKNFFNEKSVSKTICYERLRFILKPTAFIITRYPQKIFLYDRRDLIIILFYFSIRKSDSENNSTSVCRRFSRYFNDIFEIIAKKFPSDAGIKKKKELFSAFSNWI